MTLEPIFTAPFEIQLHIVFAIIALLSGPIALFRTRRDTLHKVMGYIWIPAMLGLSITSLLIKSEIALIGHFGPIHLLSIFAIWGVGEGLYHIRHRNIAKHRASMQSVWFGAMGLAGLFTLLPGRVMNRVVFGSPSETGYVVVGIGLVVLFFVWRWHLKRVS